MRAVAWMALLLLFISGCLDSGFQWPQPDDPDPAEPYRGDVTREPFLDGVERPVALLPIPDGSGRLLLVEQTGTVRWVVGATVGDDLLLDLRDRVGTCHFEQGLLGLAFSPDFAEDRRFYVAYTGLPCENDNNPFTTEEKGDLHLVRYVLPEGADHVEAAAGEVLLVVDEPYRNHNGGHVLFGPDGMLYLGVGDGGDHGDPDGNGQDPTTLLGTLLRLDVSGPEGYEVPPDNPFASGGEGAPEVYVYGLRNPWRFDFADDGALWIADVGQNDVEEVNRLPVGEAAGANLGWDRFEGSAPYEDPSSTEGLVFPVVEYGHDEADHCSVTGGPLVGDVPDAPDDLHGAYLFADFCSGVLWAAVEDTDSDTGWKRVELMDTGLQVTSFGRDADGSVLLLHWDGSVHRLVFSDPS